MPSKIKRGAVFIGWHDAKGVYLIPEAALKVTKERYPACATWSVEYFYKVLEDEGVLIGRATITIDGKETNVAHLPPDVFDRFRSLG